MTCEPKECDLLPERAAIMAESGERVTTTRVIEYQCRDCALREIKLSQILKEIRR